jgi:predicted pyridoxine 5'-phosphate oxidase superfamily flavin-nucleotide-binding protein
MTRLDSIEHLRRIIGEPTEVTPCKITQCLQSEAVEFLRRSTFLLLATANADGRPDVSPKGDEAGFVVVEDSFHLVIPERPGNRLLMSSQNILVPSGCTDISRATIVPCRSSAAVGGQFVQRAGWSSSNGC